jgi:hypothetical protein
MTSNTYPLIIKANGETEAFDPDKLRRSLERAGAESGIIENIVSIVMKELTDGTLTRDIYRRAFNLLRGKRKKPEAIRYSLRRAIAELGPSGYPFERFLGEILKRKGYDVRVGIDVKGWCAPHEIDVSAHKDGVHHLIECKFHNNHALRSDLKTALYVQARFEDLEKRYLQDKVESERFHKAWLVTNTKFTSNAIAYGSCVGMQLIGWGYPKGAGLRELVEETGVYPITVLPSLSQKKVALLLEQDIVTCADLKANPSALESIGLSDKHAARIRNELDMTCALTKSCL